MEDFQILKIRKTDGKREIKGLVDLQIGLITILGIKIIEYNGRTFCAMPSEYFFSKWLGKTLNRAIVHLEEDLKVKVYESILERWNCREELKFKGEGGQ